MHDWTDVDTPHGPVRAWRAEPPGPSKGAVVVIQEISGVALPRIGTTGVRTPTAALTSPAASVEDADETTSTPTVTAKPAVEPVAEEDPLAAKRAEIARRRREAEEAAAAELG